VPEVVLGLARSAHLLARCLTLDKPRKAECSVQHTFWPKVVLLSSLHLLAGGAPIRRPSPSARPSKCALGRTVEHRRPRFLRPERLTDTEQSCRDTTWLFSFRWPTALGERTCPTFRHAERTAAMWSHRLLGREPLLVRRPASLQRRACRCRPGEAMKQFGRTPLGQRNAGSTGIVPLSALWTSRSMSERFPWNPQRR
jgi:hypothetical protein